MQLGTDIIEISRIEKALNRFDTKFKERFLNQEEIYLAKKTASLAGFWSAKEAISKALGCGIGKELAFKDIIIRKTPKGAPTFQLTPKAQAIHQIKTSSLSISHDGGFAIAVVIIETKY